MFSPVSMTCAHRAGEGPKCTLHSRHPPLWLCSFRIHPAYAQEAFDLGEITLFSNQVLTELSRSGTTTEVVTEDEIAAAPETSVSDIIATLPGVTTTATGGVGAQTTLRIRGLGAGYVPVYLDGIDISDPSSFG
ncbi:TonB-dependent receptor plug domain-containing protein [Lentibacter algarum]|uniref:TonB-dependent receptor plug domain-containing protein n=1 Tax=Lentibacter algarum TaxID=576131 RepID=UPI003AF6D379